MTNTKGTPKSCSCGQCSRGKHTAGGRFMRRDDEHAYRHAAKIALNKYEDPVIDVGPKGNYYD